MKQKTTREPSSPHPSPKAYALWVAKNLLALLAVMAIVWMAFTWQDTYRWVYRSLLKENMKLIRQYPDLTFDEKMQMKLGASYEYLLFLKQHTPENAVILYPSPAAFTKEGSPIKHEIYNKVYATRFLYPRLLVTEEELPHSRLSQYITHVAIVNGEGAKVLTQPLDSATKFAVLPVQPVSRK